MDEPTIEEWMDRHHVEVVRTHATNLDGLAVGKYVRRPKFLSSLPGGHAISDIALAMDITGNPHLSFWHEFRAGTFGDVLLRPDLNTIITDGTDPDLGHCLCDFTDADGNETSLCPRTLLRQISHKIQAQGYFVKAAFELEFFVFHNTFEQARALKYQNLDPVTASKKSNIYLLRNAHRVKPLMDEVIRRLNWQKFDWESWSDEGGVGQVELNFSPADPVSAADMVVRAKQLIHEVAVDQGMSVTFMASMGPGYGNGMHIHHSLTKLDGEPVFLNDGARSPLMQHWLAGITKTMPAATSFVCPTFNAYRRLKDFTSPPVTATWGEENKSAGLRTISRSPASARLEHRLPSGDANPYLALAVILAGGLAGEQHQLPIPAELQRIGWGTPEADAPKLPTTIMAAVKALEQDPYLKEILGEDVIDYWVNTRKLEWLAFHEECGDTRERGTTLWEFERYFELS